MYSLPKIIDPPNWKKKHLFNHVQRKYTNAELYIEYCQNAEKYRDIWGQVYIVLKCTKCIWFCFSTHWDTGDENQDNV